MSADDWVKVIGALAGATVIVLGAIGALYVKVHAYEQRVNGRLGELLELTRSSAKAEGRLERNN